TSPSWAFSCCLSRSVSRSGSFASAVLPPCWTCPAFRPGGSLKRAPETRKERQKDGPSNSCKDAAHRRHDRDVWGNDRTGGVRPSSFLLFPPAFRAHHSAPGPRPERQEGRCADPLYRGHSG